MTLGISILFPNGLQCGCILAQLVRIFLGEVKEIAQVESIMGAIII